MTKVTNSDLPVSGRGRTPQIDIPVRIAGVAPARRLAGAHNEVDRSPGRCARIGDPACASVRVRRWRHPARKPTVTRTATTNRRYERRLVVLQPVERAC